MGERLPSKGHPWPLSAERRCARQRRTLRGAPLDPTPRAGLPVNEQCLTRGGKPLDKDGRTLAECGIVKESTLHLALRLHGGTQVRAGSAGG